MEISEGMYVKYIRGMINGYVPPKIAKVTDCSDKDLIKIDNGQVILRNDILKASYNIIDLIEVGDYVNGYKIEEVNNNLNEHKGICNCLDTYLWCVNELDKFEEIVIFENDIKSIVTKEQFDAIKYEVE